MRRIRLPETAIDVSRLSFGTARLHHLLTTGARQKLLATALDCGFTHFDTAPYYGFGIAEEELGQFHKANLGKITLATKIGLYPPFAGPFYLTSGLIWLTKAAGKIVPSISRPLIDWSVSTAKQSLERSLRCLRTDQIDLLLLHEPTFSAIESEPLLDWLRAEQSRGRIKTWGLAGEAAHVQTWLSMAHPLGAVLQVRDTLSGREADIVTGSEREFQITYGYLFSALSESHKISVSEILNGAMRRNRGGSVLVSTTQTKRVHELARAAEASDAKN